MTTRTTHRKLAVALLVAAISTTAQAEDQEADFSAAIAGIEPSCVRVEYTVRYDNGEAGDGWYSRLEDLIAERRPWTEGGYLLSPTQVITTDPEIHPRYVEKIAVRAGNQLVPATIAAHLVEQRALILELGEPLTAAQPLKFDAQAEGPFCIVECLREDARWCIYAHPITNELVFWEDGKRVRPSHDKGILVNKSGQVAGMLMDTELPLDDSWRGSPLDWPALTAAEMEKTLAKIERTAKAGLPLIKLSFRSPKREKMSTWRYSRREEKVDTELHAVGILVDEERVLILANLPPKHTSRLERIQVLFPGEEPVAAQFLCSFREYGILLAKLDQPHSGAVVFDTNDLLNIRDTLTYTVQYNIYGDVPVIRVQPIHVPRLEIGYRDRVYPDLYLWTKSAFLFRSDGTLCAALMTLRSMQEEGWERGDSLLTPVAVIAELIADPATHADTSNVPLSVEQENRIAWLGIDMQMLDSDLARVNKVSQYTENGQTGVIVSYIYPDSPAAQAGIKPGDILLRLYFQDEPKPLRVEADNSEMETFPWHMLDEVTEEYFDQIPQPWPTIENNFTKLLTRAGFGKTVRAEFFIDGEIVMKEFKVVESPPHYESAPRFKSEKLGLTVRDLTYEVRRYFQRSADDPGIIVSKLEQGLKASVAGMKPYEIITHVNDEPIASVAEFEKILETATGELRLNVKRMTQGRIVKIRLD